MGPYVSPVTGDFSRSDFQRKNDPSSLDEIPDYLKSTTLETLLAELKAKGITQKAFAEGIGMNPSHLGAVKSSERRNHFFNELGAIKLACLWMLDHIDKECGMMMYGNG